MFHNLNDYSRQQLIYSIVKFIYTLEPSWRNHYSISSWENCYNINMQIYINDKKFQNMLNNILNNITKE